ncbi:MAG TPA: M1 family aminopeptidase [Bryobacteraceae bacterium]|nr:M1 family aminopeptidase [Bryobacteraceae bacterium]
MRWVTALVLLSGLPLLAGRGADVANAIRANSFDRDECYRVRDLTIVQEDIRIYLNDGYLIFGKPVDGKRIAAVFQAAPDGGDGEALLLPPSRAERRSLAMFTGSPNLDEHFRTAVFLFTGDVYDALMRQVPANPTNRKAPEMAPDLDEQWSPVLRNLVSSYQTRLTLDLLGGGQSKPGLFIAFISGAKLGNFDLLFDPQAPEQILAGQVAERNTRAFFDTWTSFEARSYRQRAVKPQDSFLLQDYRIDATVQPDLTMDVVTRVKLRPLVDGITVIPLNIASEMSVTSATVDGRTAEVLQRDTLRADLMRGGNALFLLALSEPLHTGRDYELEIHHSGKVIQDAGDSVYFVRARGDWYPMFGVHFSNYDLNFRYPRGLDLVTPGDIVEDKEDGDWRITRRRTSAPIRLAGFNLGKYAHARVTRGGYVVDIYANQTLERALLPKPQEVISVPASPTQRRGRAQEPPQIFIPAPIPSPVERLQALGSEVASALEFMASRFGPPALPHLTVSPIPGTFGQGFPGLIYLSTLSYLQQPAMPHANAQQELFFADVLQAHETAHQWWGNVVTAAGYHDSWLMEALANYSAMLYLEKRRGTHTMEQVLDSYRAALLAKSANGQTVDAAGPIVLGGRLESSLEPRAWQAITYGKGAWIFQMLRRRMGDDAFSSMLGSVVKHYWRKEITTEEFRTLAAQFLPPKSSDPKLEGFFDQWVYGTGIPGLKLTYSIKGKAPALRLVGKLTQSDVDDDFSVLVPIEIQMAHGHATTHWVRSESDPVTFTIPLRQLPLKVLLDPSYAVLRR